MVASRRKSSSEGNPRMPRFTKAQERAIRHSRGNLQLIACAGSGKTEVVARRVARLLDPNTRPKLAPENIVAFTFTEKAAAELKHRIITRANERFGGRVGMSDLYVGTIHGFCLQLLRDYVPDYLKFDVLNEMQQRLFVNRYSVRSGLKQTETHNGRQLKRFVDTKRYIDALNILREDTVADGALAGYSISEGLEAYQGLLAEHGYFDYSSILEGAAHQIEQNEQLREALAGRIRHLIVDEYQDVNPVQERLINQLHELGATLCVVGDDDQTIYQWRGSSIKQIVTFADRYPDVKQIQLADNFRSSAGIVDTARAFIAQNDGRLEKSMRAAETQPYEDGDVTALAFDSPEEEAAWIARTCKELRGIRFDEGGESRGLSWSDMAILLRSVRRNGAVITDALTEAQVPYIVRGLPGLFEEREAQAARLLFQFISEKAVRLSDLEHEPPDTKQLRRAWRDADLGLDAKDLNKAIRYADRVRRDLWDSGRIPRRSLQTVFLEFLRLAGAREERVPNSRGEVAMFNFGKFSQLITDYETIHYRSDSQDLLSGFTQFLYREADGGYAAGIDDDPYAVPDAVQVMTVHQAKGMQWPVVFVPALLRNRFPAMRQGGASAWHLIPEGAIDDAERYRGSLEDERRLFYVATTRSQKFLHMTWAPIEENRLYRKKSEFWDDMLAPKVVKRHPPDYRKRKRAKPQARSGVENVEFSFSDIKYFFQCPYEFKLRVLYGFNSPIAAPLGYGKGLHDALAEIHRDAMKGDIPSAAEVPSLVQRHLRTPFADSALRETLEASATRVITDYLEDNADQLPNIEFAERDVEVHLDDGVSIKGRIDLVRRIDTGETTIVDLKSNERSQDEEVTEGQLHTYALGYRELTGDRPDFVEIYELEERKPKPRSVDQHFIDKVVGQTQRAARSLRNRKLPAQPGVRKCSGCDFVGLCSKGEEAVAK